MKYIVVTGGVVSGLGKGITISSIGVVLKACGLRVTALKIDPYLNTDAGTMSPFEHGEVFVLNDGGEADLDLGNYERFLRISLTRDHNLTTGKVYNQVIKRERKGDYLGKTVQVVPHVTDAIQDWIETVAHRPVDESGEVADVCLVEVGGTVGDIESMVFLEALRQFQFRVGFDDYCHVHVSLVPVLGSVGEQKTKPTQHGTRELRSAGLSPDVIVCRSGEELEESTKRKIGMFCHLPPENVLSVHDVSNIYHVPLMLQRQDISGILLRKLKVNPPQPTPVLDTWANLADRVDSFSTTVRVALVGKYTGLQDSYLSVIKALKHSSIEVERDLEIEWIEAADLEPACQVNRPEDYKSSWDKLKSVDAIVCPGGFGDRGFEGKVLTSKFARDNKIPYLGICLGMQAAVVDYARHVLKMENANSEEFDKKAERVIVFMPEIDPNQMGGTMRLGSRQTLLHPRPDGVKTLSKYLYGDVDHVNERHRHRYEVNPSIVEKMEKAGLFFVGRDIRGQRMEIVEMDREAHPFFYATQYHPEFCSHPGAPSRPFYGLLLAAVGKLEDFIANVDKQAVSCNPEESS